MADNNKTKYSGLVIQYNEGKDFLMDLNKSTPDFEITKFRYVTPVAYPIAFIEIEALERTLEDFPVVEKTVLRLISYHFLEPSIIAKVMGLTESYIRKIIKLLLAYGQIDRNGITASGLQSLQQNASIKINTVKQKIQVDGLTANPIDIRNFISDQVLNKPQESGFFVAHIEPVMGIEKALLEKFIINNYANYVNVGEMSLHTNVERINYAKFAGIKYAKAYYLENSQGESIILCKAYDSTAKNIKDRFIWKPLYIGNANIAKTYTKTKKFDLGYHNAKESVLNLKKTLSSKRNKTDKEIKEMLDQLYPFNWAGTELKRDKKTTLWVTKKSFSTYDRFVLKMLESIAEKQRDIILFEELYGEYIIVKTKDEELLKIADYYKEKADEIGRTFIMNSMEQLSDSHKGNLFSLLERLIKNNKEGE